MPVNLDAVKAGKGLTERAACRLLAEFASRVPADQAIVELGAYRGRTTGWLCWGASKGNGAQVWAVDPWGAVDPPEYASQLENGYLTGKYASAFDEFDAHIEACGASPRAIRSTADEAGWEWTGPLVGLLWHDAQHTAEAVRADLEAWVPHMADRSVIALHDVCQPAFGVLRGAYAALTPEWGKATIHPWKKHPDRRGVAVFQR